MMTVKALCDIHDSLTGKIRRTGEEWKVTPVRGDELERRGLVKILRDPNYTTKEEKFKEDPLA